MPPWVAGVLLGYLIGSLPVGVTVGRLWARVDIRNYGSGNVGFTNMFRVLGPFPATVVLAGDVLKGVLAAYLGRNLGGSELASVLAGTAAIAGHNWSLFLRFRGGRGVATTAGVFLYLAPVPILLAFGIWALTVAITRYVSLGSILAAVSASIFMWVSDQPLEYSVFMSIAAILILIQHRANIRRLLNGTESKFGQRVRLGKPGEKL